MSSVMKEVTLSLAITISKLESDKLVLKERIAELEEQLSSTVAGLFSEKELAVHNLEQKAQACFELASEGGEDKKLTYIPLREINNFGVNYSKQAKQLKGGAE